MVTCRITNLTAKSSQKNRAILAGRLPKMPQNGVLRSKTVIVTEKSLGFSVTMTYDNYDNDTSV